MNRASGMIFFGVIATAVGASLLLISQYWPVPLVVGAVLLTWALIAPQKRNLLLTSGDGEMLIPDKWNEHEISLGLERYKSSPNLLSKYVDSVLSRFVAGQDKRTIESRTAFLESFNKYAVVARESYKWQRYMKGGRAKMEEDAEDARAEVALKTVQAAIEMVDLEAEFKRQEKLLQIEKLKREIAELNKPPAPASPPRQAATEVREQKRRDLNERENRVLEEMRITRANPTLSEEQKRRKLNALEQTLGEIHEEQASLI
jgi:hypothetical protein